MSASGAIWALVEYRDEELEDGSLELISHASDLARKMGAELAAVVLGEIPEDTATQLARYGAGHILCLQHPAVNDRLPETDAQILAAAVRQYSPDIIACLETTTGGDVSRRLAARLGTGLVTSCDRLDVGEDNLLAAVKPVYGGKAAATVICPSTRPQMATVNPDAIDLKTPDSSATAEITTVPVNIDLEDPKTRAVDFLKGDPRMVALTEAEIVVAGGMGLGSKDNWKLVEELADAIGASVAATRRVVDEGWVTSERQVGQTGKTVRPRLYIACGISGAIQHTVGMKDSQAVIAINTDRTAPIFKVADVSVVGDVVKVLPAVAARLRDVLKDRPQPRANEVFEALRNP